MVKVVVGGEEGKEIGNKKIRVRMEWRASWDI